MKKTIKKWQYWPLLLPNIITTSFVKHRSTETATASVKLKLSIRNKIFLLKFIFIILKINIIENISAVAFASASESVATSSLLSSVSSYAAAASSIGTIKPGQMGPITKCTMSEFTCTNGKCIQLNKFCDNFNDCGDSSDEPRYCTRCNRTYYGNLGITYNLELHRPKENHIPYHCELNFTAAGGIHGDIVQITLESFTLGRFVSYVLDGCPDGYLQIAEAARAPVGGMWCGSSWGPAIFYSDTRTLILTVKLFILSKDQSGYNFDFRLTYKVLPRENAVVRFGGIKYEAFKPWKNIPQKSTNFYDDYSNSSAVSDQWIFERMYYGKEEHYTRNDLEHTYVEPKYYLGTLISGTHCSRIFSDCDKKPCRLQSPNYPGIYPRNLTCYYAVRQHEVPPGKHALIIVRQPKGNLVWIQTQTSATMKKNEKEKISPHINTWNECDNVQDYITVYDGYTTRDPVILKFCGGGDSVPAAISSGPELLVEFTTSPYGTFIPSPYTLNSLNGFQLEIEVKFVNIQSPTYIKSKRICEFWLRGTGYGILENPSHSLPPNTTCLYHLQGTDSYHRTSTAEILQMSSSSSRRSGFYPTKFKVWISILKFDLAPKFGVHEEQQILSNIPIEDCNGMLRIWDGPLREVPNCKDLNCERDMQNRQLFLKYGYNYTNLLGRYCYGNIPKSCDHGIYNETHARPCTFHESYVSTGDFVTLELRNIESTVLRPLKFKLRYEFVDLVQDGISVENGISECHRKFISNSNEKKEIGQLRTSRNIFLFGRGGAKDLKCIYRFEGLRDEHIRIVIKHVRTGKRKCISKLDKSTNRSYCYGNTSVKVEIMEQPWHDSIVFPRGCICNSTNSSDLPIVYVSSSRILELHLTAVNMTAQDDPDTINFEASYEFIKEPAGCVESRKLDGPSGKISLVQEDFDCRTRPWLIESKSSKFVYVRLNGIFLRKSNPTIMLPYNTSTRLIKQEKQCETKSRIILTNGEGIQITMCPLTEESSRDDFVEMFSSGWHNKLINYNEPTPSKVISIEYIYPDHEYYSFIWLEINPQQPMELIGTSSHEDCFYKCPELKACVNSSIWCDGIYHCPSGYDESFAHCSAILRLPIEILTTICVLFVVFICGLCAFIFKKIKKRFRGTSILQTRLKSLSSMDTATFDEKDVIC